MTLPQISTQAIIEGVRAKKDRSLGLNISTPELSSHEKALFMELQGVNLHIIITPTESDNIQPYEINTDLNQKTPSERMRAVLYILWNQGGKKDDFPTYYNTRMEIMIGHLKERINEL